MTGGHCVGGHTFLSLPSLQAVVLEDAAPEGTEQGEHGRGTLEQLHIKCTNQQVKSAFVGFGLKCS